MLQVWTKSYVRPTLDLALLNQHVAASQWKKRRFSWSERMQAPTQHERPEALLRLRQWLSDKAASAEIELLLREP